MLNLYVEHEYLIFLCRIASHFDRSKQVKDEGFFKLQNWKIVESTSLPHSQIDLTASHTTSKWELNCNVHKFKGDEREMFVTTVDKSARSHKSLVPELKPSGKDNDLGKLLKLC